MNLDDIDVDQLPPVERLRAELLRSEDLDNIPPPRWLIRNVLMESSLTQIYGPPGSWKSFVALDMAAHVAAGENWHDHPTVKANVLYMVAEGRGGLPKRVRAIEKMFGSSIGVVFLPRPLQIIGDEWNHMVELCVQDNYGFIVIDTQHRSTLGIEENSAMEMGRVYARLDDLKAQTGACVCNVHHSGWDSEHGRGSTAQLGALDTALRVTRADDETVSIFCEKQKDAEDKWEIQLRTIKMLDSLVLGDIGERRDTMADILRKTESLRRAWWAYAGSRWVSLPELDSADGVSRKTIDRHKFAMENAGLIESNDRGGSATKWRLLSAPTSGEKPPEWAV